MSRADAWGDAGEIMDLHSNTVHLWPYAQELALRTTLTQDEAEGKVQNAVQQAIGELLYEFGDYGEGDGE